MKKISSPEYDQKNRSGDKITDFRQNILEKVSFEKSKKILTQSGINATDEEVRYITDFAHQLADIIIKYYILK